MRIAAGEDHLEIAVVDCVGGNRPDAGDVQLAVRLTVSRSDRRFTAETSCWVERRLLVAFADRLRTLEARRAGAADLVSMTPGELELRIETVDRAGRLGAIGSVGAWCYDAFGQPRWAAVGFGIPFESETLTALVRWWRDVVEGMGAGGPTGDTDRK